jgi:predicted N-acetyltransferase YhbS
MLSVSLDSTKHNRKLFDCGVESLNNYFKLVASQQTKRDNSRTYVLEEKNNQAKIVGFYTLTMHSIDINSLPLSLQKKHRNSNSVALIARLAVDKNYTNKGIGSWLLVDALKKILNASEIVGFPLVIVDAKDGVSAFYEQFGFEAFKDDINKLFISIAKIRASFI